MTDSRFGSPARSIGETCSLGADSENEEIFELTIVEGTPPSPDLTLIDGNLKFRDFKRWKPRWGVLTKLSPAAGLSLVIVCGGTARTQLAAKTMTLNPCSCCLLHE
ncbi:hypothetical protein LSTR_LSTR012438 [Laodelphax striatellus]|uniref:Uncharacterized protein n=1 Tax=Laodelphax striatellus TaxID=195883 RepID=A0A482WEQ1_LAOST|nr:hypothetical protein LSTR_LSTR012438 [Laodelphax striatellus]